MTFFAVDFSAKSNTVASAESTEEQLGESVENGISNLDTDSFDRFLKSLLEEQQRALSFSSVKEILIKIASGENSDFFGTFLSLIWECFATYFLGFIPMFLSIIIIVILQSILSGMTSGFKKQSTGEIIHFVCYSAIIVMLLVGITNIIISTTKTVQNMTQFAEIIFPILLTLLSAVGGVSSAAIYAPLMAGFSNIIIQIINVVIMPAFIATIVFSVVGNISKNVKLDKLTKLFKSGAGWLLGIVFGLFMAFVTTQGIVASTYDGIGFSAAKFALSSYVPILGGYLSDGFDLVAASLVLVKNSVGLVAVVTLLSIVLFPILKTVVFVLCLKLTSAIVEPLGNERVTSLMHSLSKNMSLLIAALAGVGFMFFVILLLILSSCNMGL
ncbi:MAG: stage III sporulation protein AE [Clostridia bacterium]|nr:stage III sporulation protein AE [Clostridia bacterium]